MRLFDWSYTVEFSFRDRYFLPFVVAAGLYLIYRAHRRYTHQSQESTAEMMSFGFAILGLAVGGALLIFWPNLNDLIFVTCIAGAAVAGRVVDHFVHPTRTNPRHDHARS
jgi:hypothetical protein